MKTRDELIDELIDLAFAEDIGDGDATTLCCIPADEMGRSRLIVKEEGILAGVAMAKRVFQKFDPELKMTTYIADGSHVKPGDIAFVVEGRVQSLLQTERLMLNIMQRMSGIATTTYKYQKELEGLKTKVLDTRKTTPGMRIMEKDAVALGGGCNHRIGLFDMILLKDNHIDFAGGIKNAITKAHEWCKANNKDLKIEIEVRNLDELRQVLEQGRSGPHHARQLHPRTHQAGSATHWRTLRGGVVGRHHVQHAARLWRVRCGLHLGGCAHTLGEVARHEFQGFLTASISSTVKPTKLSITLLALLFMASRELVVARPITVAPAASPAVRPLSESSNT